VRKNHIYYSKTETRDQCDVANGRSLHFESAGALYHDAEQRYALDNSHRRPARLSFQLRDHRA